MHRVFALFDLVVVSCPGVFLSRYHVQKLQVLLSCSHSNVCAIRFVVLWMFGQCHVKVFVHVVVVVVVIGHHQTIPRLRTFFSRRPYFAPDFGRPEFGQHLTGFLACFDLFPCLWFGSRAWSPFQENFARRKCIDSIHGEHAAVAGLCSCFDVCACFELDLKQLQSEFLNHNSFGVSE